MDVLESAAVTSANGPAVAEVYEVVRAAEFVLALDTCRLEVLRLIGAEVEPFQCRAYFKRQVTFVHDYGNSTRNEQGDVWILDDTFPWTARDSADAALAQAISFLRQRVSD